MEEKIFRSKKHKESYLKYLYHNYKDGEKCPLIIYIHGAGSRGNDLKCINQAGPIGELEKGRYIPAKIVCPQCHCDTWFELYEVLLEFIEECIEWCDVDSKRIYLCGVSMGAYASWQLAMSRPQWFTALVAVCGGGMYWNAERLKDISIWAFHGVQDSVVLPEESLHMVNAVNQRGGKARLTMYPDTEHDSWVKAFAEDELWDWMFQQCSHRF